MCFKSHESKLFGNQMGQIWKLSVFDSLEFIFKTQYVKTKFQRLDVKVFWSALSKTKQIVRIMS